MKTEHLIPLMIAAVLVIAGVAYVLYDDGEGGEEERHHISFFFYDRHTYDDTAGILAEDKNIANGIWVKGYGNTKAECFEDACRRLGITFSLSDELDIESLNGIVDGNFHQMGWILNKWSATISLASDETYPIGYMAIGHGIGKTVNPAEKPTPPTPWQTPDDIKWYYGEGTGDDSGTMFYFYDNFENDPPSAASSDVLKFVADGYWITGHGGTAVDAFKDVCSHLGKYSVFDESSGEIYRIDDVNDNIHTLEWNGSAWVKCDLSAVFVSSGTYIAIGYGMISEGGEPPTPWETPNDISWSI